MCSPVLILRLDALKDVQTLLQSTPKGVISMTDVSGVCYFTRPPPSSKKPTKFVRCDWSAVSIQI